MKQHTVASLSELVGGRLVGHGDQEIRGVSDLESAGSDQVGFVRDGTYREAARDCSAGAIIVGEEIETRASQIVVDGVYAAFAKIALELHPAPRARHHAVHPTAFADPEAVLGEPVQIGPKVVIEAGAQIGAGSVLMAGVLVGERCTIGRDCVLYPGVTLYPNSQLGDRVLIHAGTVIGSDGFGYALREDHGYTKLPQLGNVILDDDVEIGANCTVDRGTLGPTRIGRGSKVDNLVHLAHNCVLGEDNAVAALSALSGSTILGDRVVIGGHTVSNGHLKVADDVRIGGNSAIHGDLSQPGDYLGYPLMEKPRFARHLVALRHLVDIYQHLRKANKREA
jgi:UDP-3-O-[3-hydroxymyristoyl] glucosamine N-acyltransferase